MVVSAAVKIFDKKQNKEICIPCHRHCDAFFILKEFGYTKNDYEEIAQGFLDEHWQFLNRHQAYSEAKICGQIIENFDFDFSYAMPMLYSEDLW